MIERKYLFPSVIELNLQAGRPLGVNLYLIDGETEWALIDVGQEDILEEVIELIRQLDFPLSKCKMLLATHADADHVQGLAKARERLKAKTAAHPRAAVAIEAGDAVETYAKSMSSSWRGRRSRWARKSSKFGTLRGTRPGS
jgi:hydroxyacylglutathione hydrolase